MPESFVADAVLTDVEVYWLVKVNTMRVRRVLWWRAGGSQLADADVEGL